MSYFSREELACKHCGAYVFDEDFLELINSIREECGFPLHVSSGYRCPEHPKEAAKENPGSHSTGRAVDLQVSHEKAHRVLVVALEHGVKRVGVHQKGPLKERFIHLDCADMFYSPTVWSY